MSPYAVALYALAIENQTETSTIPMSEAEWNRMHGLRNNGKGLTQVQVSGSPSQYSMLS